ncbi:hypothetical protein NECAME_10404 [Necator americanus]|uniref:Uncharacterized protein n=1 Tax=Necator americanus TaxID=51031 RepID=W2T8L9_NECAM|nr:hypothetical protein NECAME_10404 [Necator americanus]ETN78340.1 hypothetical protein NECAME_10404 [Necator americanus]
MRRIQFRRLASCLRIDAKSAFNWEKTVYLLRTNNVPVHIRHEWEIPNETVRVYYKRTEGKCLLHT